MHATRNVRTYDLISFLVLKSTAQPTQKKSILSPYPNALLDLPYPFLTHRSYVNPFPRTQMHCSTLSCPFLAHSMPWYVKLFSRTQMHYSTLPLPNFVSQQVCASLSSYLSPLLRLSFPIFVSQQVRASLSSHLSPLLRLSFPIFVSQLVPVRASPASHLSPLLKLSFPIFVLQLVRASPASHLSPLLRLSFPNSDLQALVLGLNNPQ